MVTDTKGLWLGPLRGPTKMAMIGLIGLTVVLSTWFFVTPGPEDGGVSQFLPAMQHRLAQAALICGLAAAVVAGIYLSDTRGAIEGQPTGPFDILSLICGRIAMIGVAFVVLVMTFEVISRYIFDSATLWANELSLWIAGFVFLLAGQYAMQQRSHIRIYVIYDLMPRWLRKCCDVLSVLLIWFFAFSLVWGGFNEARDKWGRMETYGTAWDSPLPATIIPATLIIISLVAIQALSNLIADWNKDPESHSPMDDIDEVEIENIRKAVGD